MFSWVRTKLEAFERAEPVVRDPVQLSSGAIQLGVIQPSNQRAKGNLRLGSSQRSAEVIMRSATEREMPVRCRVTSE